MTARPLAPFFRILLLLALGAVAAPICGAAQQAPDAPSTPAKLRADGVVQQPWMQTVALDGTPFPLMAQLGNGTMVDSPPLLLARVSDSLPTGFATTSTQAPRPEPTAMGLPLPEPGPLSAIIATIALAGFFFVRRAS